MARWAEQYRKEPGEYGTDVIEVTGLCTPDEAISIERGATRRYVLVPIPHAQGVVLKSLDGTTPQTVSVRPLTWNTTYRCVKIYGGVNPFAGVQDGGTHANNAILIYTIRYQVVG